MKRLHQILERNWQCAGLIVLFSFLIHGNTLSHRYNMDDELVTMNHPRTSKGFAGFGEILRSSYYEDAQGYSYEYRPVTHMSFAIEHQLFGENPSIGHLFNVMFLAFTCLLVFLLAKRLIPIKIGLFALFASLLFTVHPMHSEVVASIKNRDELLALIFGLLATWQAMNYMGKGGFLSLLWIPLFLLLGLLSKTSIASFFVVLPIVPMTLGAPSKRTLAIILSTLFAFPVFSVAANQSMTWTFLLSACIAGLYAIVWIARYPRRTVQALWGAVVLRIPLSGLVVWSKPTAKEIITVLASLILLILHWTVKGDHFLPIAIIVMALTPFWVGRHLMLHNAIALLTTLTASHFYGLRGIMFLFFLQVAAVLVQNRIAVNPKLWGLIVIIPLAHVITELVSGGGPGSLQIVVAYLPLLLLIFMRRRIWGNIIFVSVVSVSAGVSIFQGIDLDLSLSIIYGVSALLLFNAGQKPVSSLAFPILSFLVVVGCLYLPMIASIERPYIEVDTLITATDSETRTPVNGVHEASPSESPSSTLEDRPLTMVEFPLGTDASLNKRIGTASVILGHYLKMMFIPWPQAFYYGYDEVPLANMKDPWAIVSAVLHMALLLLALALVRSHRVLSFGILSYLASIFLFSNLVSPVAGMIADRLTYVASFGFCLALGYVFHLLFERFNAGIGRKVVTAAFALLLVGWGGMTIARNAQWKDALTLMRHDIKHVPNSAQAHNLLASHLMKNSFEPEYTSEAMNMRLEAIGHFKQSARIWPEFFNVWYDIGRAYMTINQPDNALPAYKEAHRLDSTFYDATINIAMISEQRGNISQAIDYYERCIRINPEMQEPYGNLSYLLFREGSFAESAVVNELAIIQHPAWKDPYLNLSRTYQAMGDMDRANEFALKAQQMP